jgi:uncharacterized protein YegP (UPF0339 family)
MPGKFVVRHKQGGQYHFVLKAENGHVLATRETYTTKRRWLDGIESVKRRAADAPVADAAPDGYAAGRRPPPLSHPLVCARSRAPSDSLRRAGFSVS